MVIHAGSTHRLSTTLRRYVVIALVVCLALPDVFAQVSSNTCGTNAANKYPVNNTCVNRGFNVPTSYTATYNPGGCNAGANFDGYGWFTATSTLTTVRFTPAWNRDGILHVLAACGGTVLGCSDVYGNGGAETVTIPTVIGNNYFVRVQRKNNDDGMNGNLCVYNEQRPIPTVGDCMYTLSFFDSWGDGWNSSYVGVYINGDWYGNWTINGAGGFLDFAVNIGDVVELVYNASGSYQNENSFVLTKTTPCGIIYSSGFAPTAGVSYTGTVTCTPPAAAPQDCVGGTTLCSNASITSNSTHTGCNADLNDSNKGCLSAGENQGTWYYFSPSSSGTLGFTLVPHGSTDDYDFALWGPFSSAQCPTGPPIRCSYYDGRYYGNTTTGMGNGATEPSEGPYHPPQGNDPNANGWVSTLNVIADMVYVLYIDNYSSTGQAFDLTWQLTNGASLDCTTLPVELLSLDATARTSVIDVTWATASERNSDHFDVQRSADNEHFATIGTVGAAGDAQFRNDYLFVDEAPLKGANYYRLRQVDRDGTVEFTKTVVAFMGHGADSRPVIFPNPATDVLNVAFNTPLDGSVVLYVQDAVGRTVTQSAVVLLRGERTAVIPTADLANGWYNLRIALPDGTVRQGGGFLKK